METISPRFTLGALARILDGQPEGPEDAPLERPVPAGDEDPLGVTFAESEKFLELAESSDIGAIIVAKDARTSYRPLIRVDNPRLAFGKLLLVCKKELLLPPGIHPTAVIDPTAVVDPSASIGPYVVVEGGTRIESKARIFPFCYVGENCVIGEESVLYPHTVLYGDVIIGKGSILHSGSVLGADGFGFVWDGSRRVKVPQVGRVSIGNGVEIGANTTIDRATAGSTSIDNGTKIDNLVQIAHNVKVGEHCVIAGLSGISGSTTVGNRVMMGGNVGTNDHVAIADDVNLGGRSSVDRDITKAGDYFGTPSRPSGEAKRSMLLHTRLPEMLSRIRTLEKKIDILEKNGS